ncbi:MAG TPA: ROK family protein, partial [Capsulimonadaceae bacterium]|nr:ROK family protein [Capsulimonadaceae bacterium]
LVAAAAPDGRILRRALHATPSGLAEGIDLLTKMAREVAAEEPVLAIGAAIGGPLDWRQGIVSPLHQHQWRDVPLRTIFENEFEVPFAVDVDTNIAALGEYRFGSRVPERLIYITVSTGVGGGILIDGQIYRGASGAHPEIGHQAIPFRSSVAGINGELMQCECGASGCLEVFVSGRGIRRLYGKRAEGLSDNEWDEVGYNLGQGLRNVAVMYAPDLIVLGGGVAIGGGKRLLRTAESAMAENLKLVPPPEVQLSRLGYETALMGAVALAMTVAS